MRIRFVYKNGTSRIINAAEVEYNAKNRILGIKDTQGVWYAAAGVSKAEGDAFMEKLLETGTMTVRGL